MTRQPGYHSDASLMGGTHPAAALVCLLGVFLRIVISTPVMDMLGIDYIGEAGSGLAKIHIGNYFIFLSFFILLADHGRPLRQWIQAYREHKAFSRLALLILLLFVYWMMRGPKGAGMLIDTHLPVPLTAIVLSYAPRSYCRRAIKLLIAFALVNSLIGIAESIGRFRVFTFDPNWVVLKEDEFRSSALLGHPFNGAFLATLAILVVLELKGRPFFKTIASVVFVFSLVAFGERLAFVFSGFLLCILGARALKNTFRQLTLLKFFALLAAVLIVPIVLFGGLYMVLSSPMGERLRTFSSLSDQSAQARVVAFHAFDFLTKPELYLGVGSDRVAEIIERMNSPMSDIENPWVLMIMHLGVIFFAVWLAMTLVFVKELVKDKSFILKLAVLDYFVIASSFDSFGRKDFLYTILVFAVICAHRGFEPEPERPEPALADAT